MADPLALYAAIVGTVGFGWQVWRETRRLRTDLRVEFEHAAASSAILMAVIPDPDPRPYPLEYELSLVVVNDGETTEHVRNIWVENVARNEGIDLSGADGNQKLVPRARLSAPLQVQHADVDLSKGFIGIVRLASGRLIESNVDHLQQHLLDHIAEHNHTARPC